MNRFGILLHMPDAHREQLTGIIVKGRSRYQAQLLPVSLQANLTHDLLDERGCPIWLAGCLEIQSTLPRAIDSHFQHTWPQVKGNL
mmetsp:Transcript_27733/g.89626  ORF Transcript_27733/g.89626 Transcript_27733/m.89626 type:complete len:86 (-) Transcript_27733:650-907(-)